MTLYAQIAMHRINRDAKMVKLLFAEIAKSLLFLVTISCIVWTNVQEDTFLHSSINAFSANQTVKSVALMTLVMSVMRAMI